VTRAEARAAAAALSSGRRGALLLAVEEADLAGNRDGAADLAEVMAVAHAAALRRLDEGEAAALRALLTLDADGDGALALAEVRAAAHRAALLADSGKAAGNDT
jgi:hypothetical protein